MHDLLAALDTELPEGSEVCTDALETGLRCLIPEVLCT